MNKRVKVGADPFPPYQYYDASGELQGSDYETINKILLAMSLEPEYELDDWGEIEKKLIEKKLDVAFQVQKTPEREALYYFSNLLRNAVTTLVSTGQTLSKIDDIVSQNKKLAVISNYKYGELIDSLPDRVKIFVKDMTEQLNFVRQGAAEFAVVDLGVFNYVSDKENNTFKVHQNVNFNRPLYVVFHDPELRDKFNDYL